MLLLTSTSDIIRVVTTAAAAVQVHASYIDNNAGTITPARTNTAQISTATTTTVVASPSASVQRNVKFLNITNASATVTTNVTVQHFDGTTSEDLIGVTLLPGENLVLSSTGDWMHHDAQGADYAYTPGATANVGPNGTLAETIPRQFVTSTSGGTMTSGTVYLCGINLPSGTLVSNITLCSVGAAGTPTHYQFGLYSGSQSAPSLLASSADQTATPWAANTVKTLAMTAPYRITTPGVYYIAYLMVATTASTLAGMGPKTNVALAAPAPMSNAASTTGVTATLPATGTALTSSTVSFYAAIS